MFSNNKDFWEEGGEREIEDIIEAVDVCPSFTHFSVYSALLSNYWRTLIKLKVGVEWNKGTSKRIVFWAGYDGTGL